MTKIAIRVCDHFLETGSDRPSVSVLLTQQWLCTWYWRAQKFLHAASGIYRELLYIVYSGARVTDVPYIIHNTYIYIDCERATRLCGARPNYGTSVTRAPPYTLYAVRDIFRRPHEETSAFSGTRFFIWRTLFELRAVRVRSKFTTHAQMMAHATLV